MNTSHERRQWQTIILEAKARAERFQLALESENEAHAVALKAAYVSGFLAGVQRQADRAREEEMPRRSA